MTIETNIIYGGELNPSLDEKVDELARNCGLLRVSSGYGFGARDLQYSEESDGDHNLDNHEEFVESIGEDPDMENVLSHISTTITYLNNVSDEKEDD